MCTVAVNHTAAWRARCAGCDAGGRCSAGHRARRDLADHGQRLAGRTFERDLAEHGDTLLRPSASASATAAANRYSKKVRQLFESVNDTLKGPLDLERHGGQSVEDVAIRVAQRVLALAAAIWHDFHTRRPPADHSPPTTVRNRSSTSSVCARRRHPRLRPDDESPTSRQDPAPPSRATRPSLVPHQAELARRSRSRWHS